MKSAKWENIFKGWDNSESETVHTLKKVPVFKELSDKDFAELEKMMHHRDFNSGDFVFKNRAPGEGMYIIMRGSVKITVGTRAGNENVLAELNQGELLFFKNVGAYGSSMTSSYNSRPVIMELIIYKNKFSIIRKVDTVSNQISREKIPSLISKIK